MKTFLLLFITTCTIFKTSNGQVASFRINNQSSSIVTETKKDKITTKDGDEDSVYKTLDIINYNFLDITKKSKKTQLKTLIDQLYDNSTQADGGPVFNKDTIEYKSKQVKILQAEISKIESDQDSLYFLYTKDYLNYKNVTILRFGSLRSRAFFDMVYNNGGKRFKALGNAGVSFGNNSASLYSEIASGNLGLFRVSLGTMISNSENQDANEEKKEEAYQRLVNYGGNTVLTFEYPLAYIHSGNNQYNLISRFIAKGTSDFPAFGTNTEEWAGSASVGIDFYGDAALSNNQLRFFFNFNANLIYGSDVFKTNLDIDKNQFTFGQLTFGLVFLENFKLSFIVSTLSSQESLRNKKVVAGGQVLR